MVHPVQPGHAKVSRHHCCITDLGSTKGPARRRRTSVANRTVSVDIKRHPTSDTHWLVIVTTTRGRSYFCTWSDPRPTEEEVRAAWREDRRSFQPHQRE
jgi:hypothetical protein